MANKDNKFILISMQDESSKHLADVLGNKTAKKIIDFLAETKQASEKEISQALKSPINTVEYNLNKLLKANLIEKAKQHFWSTKGKKIAIYKISNKSIVISPKPVTRISSKLKTIVPAALISGLGAVLVRQYVFAKQVATNVQDEVVRGTIEKVAPTAITDATDAVPEILTASPSPIWIWFLAGAVFALFIFAILNWRRL